jgi:hypothetical protein
LVYAGTPSSTGRLPGTAAPDGSQAHRRSSLEIEIPVDRGVEAYEAVQRGTHKRQALILNCSELKGLLCRTTDLGESDIGAKVTSRMTSVNAAMKTLRDPPENATQFSASLNLISRSAIG